LSIFKIKIRLTIELKYLGKNKFIRNEDLSVKATNTKPDIISVSSKRIGSKYYFLFKGNNLPQRTPGNNIQTSTVALYTSIQGSSDAHLGIEIYIKGGCPPSLRFSIDQTKTKQMTQSNNKYEASLNCPGFVGNSPCFEYNSDYHLYFTVFDTHHMLNVPFNGNFTIKVVGGGRGVYQKNNSNFRFFTQKEIEKFNYIPGKRKASNSLIWSTSNNINDVLNEETGSVIFDSSKPQFMRFICKVNSPCGDGKFLSFFTPDTFHFLLEVSNSKVDSSTNCNFTNNFLIHVNGLHLHPTLMLFYFLIWFTTSIVVIHFLYKHLARKEDTHVFELHKMRMTLKHYDDEFHNITNIINQQN